METITPPLTANRSPPAPISTKAKTPGRPAVDLELPKRRHTSDSQPWSLTATWGRDHAVVAIAGAGGFDRAEKARWTAVLVGEAQVVHRVQSEDGHRAGDRFGGGALVTSRCRSGDGPPTVSARSVNENTATGGATSGAGSARRRPVVRHPLRGR